MRKRQPSIVESRTSHKCQRNYFAGRRTGIEKKMNILLKVLNACSIFSFILFYSILFLSILF